MTEREAEAGVAALANYGFDAGIQRGKPYSFGTEVAREYYIQVGRSLPSWSSDDVEGPVYLSDLDGVVEFLDAYRASGGKKL